MSLDEAAAPPDEMKMEVDSDSLQTRMCLVGATAKNESLKEKLSVSHVHVF